MPAPIQLYLVRHGIAEERGEAWPDDTKRPLTDEGMARLRKSARGLDRLGVVFDLVLASPLAKVTFCPLVSIATLPVEEAIRDE